LGYARKEETISLKADSILEVNAILLQEEMLLEDVFIEADLPI
jgi:hypothetical protein